MIRNRIYEHQNLLSL